MVERIREEHGGGGWFLALYAGGLGRYYGLDTLVEAARLLQSRKARIKLVLLGTGTERARIAQTIRDEDLSTMALAGPVTPDEVAPYLQAADVLVACLGAMPYENDGLYTKECQ